jgi:hypothetical protein
MPWTKFGLELQPALTRTRTLTSATPVLCRSGIYVFAGDGTTLYRTTDMVTWTAMSAPGGTIQAMTTDGTDLYVGTSTGMVKYVGAATTLTAFSTPVTGNVTNVAFVTNRLLAGIDNVLSEVGGTGALTTIYTHFQPAFRWTTIFNIGSRIYVGGFAGVRSELYTLGTLDTTGALYRAQEAAPFPIGELLRTAISYAGAVVLCTSRGVRLAQVGGDATLTYGPLIDDFGDVRCVTADAQYVYAGWSSYPNGGSGLGRLDLSKFVAPLQPAYATDVATSATGNVLGVVRLNNLTAFALGSDGVYVQTVGTFQLTGQVTTGRIYLGTVEPKGLVDINVQFDALAPDQSVQVRVTDSLGTLIASDIQTVVNATQLTVDLNGTQTTWCDVAIILNGPGTSTPRVDRWRLRAYPVQPPALQWLLPIRCGEVVRTADGEGMELSQDVALIRARIVGLWQTKRQVIFREGPFAYRVRVAKFEFQPLKWSDDGEALQGQLVVQLVSTP